MTLPRNILIFYSVKNSGNKHDASGAFIPEARAFAASHGVPAHNMFGVDCVTRKKARRREQVFSALSTQGANSIDGVAFFGHGWPQGIQFGFNRTHIPKLTAALAKCCRADAKVALYACLAAENDELDTSIGQLGPATDGGFADLLRDEMMRLGIDKGWVDAHKTSGHATWNPWVVRFKCENVEHPAYGGVGGKWLVTPKGRAWKAWGKACHGPLRLQYPFMTEKEIRSELLNSS